jgi:hypothetical protein
MRPFKIERYTYAVKKIRGYKVVYLPMHGGRATGENENNSRSAVNRGRLFVDDPHL